MRELLGHAQGRLARVLTSPETKRFRPNALAQRAGLRAAARGRPPRPHLQVVLATGRPPHISFGPPCSTSRRLLARQILPEPSGVVSAGGLCSRSPFRCWPESKECLCTGFTYKDLLRRLAFKKCRCNFHTVLWPGSMSMGRLFRCVQPGSIQ